MVRREKGGGGAGSRSQFLLYEAPQITQHCFQKFHAVCQESVSMKVTFITICKNFTQAAYAMAAQYSINRSR